MEEPVEQVDVLAVGAHPDDVEIACGGTLAKLVQQGHRVGIIDLTDGEPTPLSPGPEVRLAEARRAAEVLGAVVRVTLDLPNRRLVRQFRGPAGPGEGVSQVPAAAGHWAWGGHAAGLARPRPGRHDYRSGGLLLPAVEVGGAFRGLAAPQRADPALVFPGLPAACAGRHGIVVDIGDVLEKKMAAIACYESQFPPVKAGHLDGIRAYARQQGTAAGFAAGEVLASPGAWGTRDLMGLVFG